MSFGKRERKRQHPPPQEVTSTRGNSHNIHNILNIHLHKTAILYNITFTIFEVAIAEFIKIFNPHFEPTLHLTIPPS
jgi:hypothetical protein